MMSVARCSGDVARLQEFVKCFTPYRRDLVIPDLGSFSNVFSGDCDDNVEYGRTER